MILPVCKSSSVCLIERQHAWNEEDEQNGRDIAKVLSARSRIDVSEEGFEDEYGCEDASEDDGEETDDGDAGCYFQFADPPCGTCALDFWTTALNADEAACAPAHGEEAFADGPIFGKDDGPEGEEN